MHEAFEEEIRRLLESGNKIEAIKRYREEAGVGLAEAKAAVESLQAGGAFTERAKPNDPDLTNQIINLLKGSEKIEAIKLYRQRFHVGLREAKEAVERIGEQNGIPPSSASGCLGIVLCCLGPALLYLTL